VRTKAPSLRITKWLRTVDLTGAEVPLEAECTACADVQFHAPFSIRHHLIRPFHQPDRERFLKALQSAFDRHVKTMHSNDI
jgi:hypothetical protein